ncbi:MAG TPA: hypothetical protein VHX66_08810 [Solirubrobacteraceae bacterium]|nr:hypothetical protein [Solirubrobacteraceae bacterium]
MADSTAGCDGRGISHQGARAAAVRSWSSSSAAPARSTHRSPAGACPTGDLGTIKGAWLPAVEPGADTVDGFVALDWRFDVDQDGVLLEKDDVFFVDRHTDEGVAVLAQAPADMYPNVSRAFAALRQTLVMN